MLDLFLASLSIAQGDTRSLQHEPPRCTNAAKLPINTSFAGSCEVVTSVFRDADGVLELAALMPQSCQLVVYDRRPAGEACANSSELPPRARCVPLGNIGQDTTHTWVHYVLDSYHDLPDFVIATSASLDKRNRWSSLRQEMLATSFGVSDDSFACIRTVNDCDFLATDLPSRDVRRTAGDGGVPLSWLTGDTMASPHQSLLELSELQIDDYIEQPVHPAFEDARPLRQWLQRYVRDSNVSLDSALHAGACHFSAFATTSSNLRAHPRSVYEGLAAAFAANPAVISEDAFFVEFSAMALFGAGAI